MRDERLEAKHKKQMVLWSSWYELNDKCVLEHSGKANTTDLLFNTIQSIQLNVPWFGIANNWFFRLMNHNFIHQMLHATQSECLMSIVNILHDNAWAEKECVRGCAHPGRNHITQNTKVTWTKCKYYRINFRLPSYQTCFPFIRFPLPNDKPEQVEYNTQ